MDQIAGHENSICDNISFSKVTLRSKNRNRKKKPKYIEEYMNDCEEQSPSYPNLMKKNYKNNIYVANNNNNAFPTEISSLSVNSKKDLKKTNTPKININKSNTENTPKEKRKKLKFKINETGKTEDICEDKDELPNNNSKTPINVKNDTTPGSKGLLGSNSILHLEREDKIADKSFESSLSPKPKKKKKMRHEVVVDNHLNCNQLNNKEINLSEDDIVQLNKHTNKNKSANNNESPNYTGARDNQEIIIENDKPELLVAQLNDKEERKPKSISEIYLKKSSFDLLQHDLKKKHKETFDYDTWESTVDKPKKKTKTKHKIFIDEGSSNITQSNYNNNTIEDRDIIETHSHKYRNVKHKKRKKFANDSFNVMQNILPPEGSPNMLLNNDVNLYEKNHNSNIQHKKKHKKPANEIGYIENILLEKALNNVKSIKKDLSKTSSNIKVVQKKLKTKDKEEKINNNLDNSDEQVNNEVKKKQKKKINGWNIDDMTQKLLSKAIENRANSSGTDVCHSETENSTNSSKDMSHKLGKSSSPIHKVKHSRSQKHKEHKSRLSKHSYPKNDIEKIQQTLISAALKKLNLASKTPVHQKLSVGQSKERQNESNKKIKHASKKETSRISDLRKVTHYSKKKKMKMDKTEDSLEVMTSRLLAAALKKKSIL